MCGGIGGSERLQAQPPSPLTLLGAYFYLYLYCFANYWCAVRRAAKPALQQYDILKSRRPATESAEAVALAAQKMEAQWHAVSHILHKEADQLAAKAASAEVGCHADPQS